MSSETNKIKLLSTRTIHSYRVFKDSKIKIEIEVVPFISTKNIIDKKLVDEISKFAIPGIFTSVHAVESVLENMNQKKMDFKIQSAFAVAGRTATALENIKLNILGSANSSSELAKKIIQSGTKELVYFCGDKRRDELTELLKKENILLHEIIVYETVLTPSKVDENKFDGILFFSPSAVESYFSNNSFSKKVTNFCIGKTTADAVSKKQPDSKIIISDEPSEKGLLKAIYNFYKIND